MESIKLFDSELKLMELIWPRAPVSAKELARLAAEEIGWNKNTTYTILKKLASKGAIARQDPDFICTPLISKEQVQQDEADTLINKLFAGSRKAFFSSFLSKETLSKDEIAELKRMIEKHGE
ncbi:MAG: BlaI/MecI/CopY family transcriptional regulator [Clostridia bacterium]